ncbi:MAG: MFS transporter, partial [Leuconostoc falkenbergense]
MQQTGMSPLNAHHFSAYQKKVIASTAAGFGLENMDVMFLSFTLSSMIVDLHISGAAAGLISSITNLGMLIGGLFFGILADKYGRVKVFTYTIWIFAIATALMFFAKNVYWVYALRFLAGIGAGGEYGSGMAIIAESFPKRAIAKVTSLSAIGGQIGAILAAILAAVILPILGWHTLYVFGLLPVILIFFIRRHLSESKVFTDMQAKQTSTEYRPGSITALFATPAQAWQTIALMIMVMVQIAGYFGLMNWLPSIMQKRIGLTAASSSLWMIATIIGMSLGMLTFGAIMDKFGARRAYTIFLIASALAVFVL